MPVVEGELNFSASDSPGLTRGQRRKYAEISTGRNSNPDTTSTNTAVVPRDPITTALASAMGFRWEGVSYLASMFQGTMTVSMLTGEGKTSDKLHLPSGHPLVARTEPFMMKSYNDIASAGNDTATIVLDANLVWTAHYDHTDDSNVKLRGEMILRAELPKTVIASYHDRLGHLELRDIMKLPPLEGMTVEIEKITSMGNQHYLEVDLDRLSRERILADRG